MHEPANREDIRSKAQLFEAALPPEQRKRLGQFFTGMPLGKLLAHLALTRATRTVLDPMAGHGDLLDATREAARERGNVKLRRLDGIEIDPATAELCRTRLEALGVDDKGKECAILDGNAFAVATFKSLPWHAYDLTITNPPYVRYQSQRSDQSAREGLLSIIRASGEASHQLVWRTLAEGYSGLADLSIPASILAALTVAPSGRLALVLPATWRSREYGDVLRYLLLRCFQLEYIVEDTQPGWFFTALVRTNLIVARRLSVHETALPLSRRGSMPSARFVRIAPQAGDKNSLVGTAFGTECPEADMARWIETHARGERNGLEVRPISLADEWMALRSRAVLRSWYQSLEPDETGLPLFSKSSQQSVVMPEELRDLIADKADLSALRTLEATGIQVGQGLRTGCNLFFYVDVLGEEPKGLTRIRTSAAFGGRELLVPTLALRPVLRRQAELTGASAGKALTGRVLDLRDWVLPEDAGQVAQARDTYLALGATVPQIMPDDLASFVRDAAETTPRDQDHKRISELSAVRTNVRTHKPGTAWPRFWYMLPDFMPRHKPAAFVARINHGAPWVECVDDPQVLIDANFSTFWSVDGRWTRWAIKALLNSAWGQLFMEALGTPMGGGALKLEAVQLKQLPLPPISDQHRCQLDNAGKTLTRDTGSGLARVDAVMTEALDKMFAQDRSGFVTGLRERTENLRQLRLRRAA